MSCASRVRLRLGTCVDDDVDVCEVSCAFVGCVRCAVARVCPPRPRPTPGETESRRVCSVWPLGLTYAAYFSLTYYQRIFRMMNVSADSSHPTHSSLHTDATGAVLRSRNRQLELQLTALKVAIKYACSHRDRRIAAYGTHRFALKATPGPQLTTHAQLSSLHTQSVTPRVTLKSLSHESATRLTE